MAKNIFEELQVKKQKISAVIAKAAEQGWITAEEKADFSSKLENDVLTIGVIGQMKAGKSTFLNAFVFEDDVLPSATTPMTAALSVITYGPEKKLIAEFYNQEEWQEQLMTAQHSLAGISDELLKSKIKAAKELVEKSSKLGSSLNSLLGKTQEDSFDNLEEYVGADGKYVSITKSVTIYYPKEYLKGVNIVDTPGFNDPIVSREERTKEFLKKADVVLLLVYAGRPFDATDREILFKNVAECGIGKVLIGINKYDMVYKRGNEEEQICDYVRNEIAKASREMGNNLLNDILRDAVPIPLSAEMALLSVLPMSKIKLSDSLSHAWNRYCDMFYCDKDESSLKDLRDLSHIEDLISAIRQVIEREKESILFKKPLNAVLARGNSLVDDVDEKTANTKAEIAMLEMPDDDLEELKRELPRIIRRIKKKIEGLGVELDSTFDDIKRRSKQQLEDAVDSACHKMNGIVDSWGKFSSFEKLKGELDREYKFLVSRTMRRCCDDIIRDAKHRLKTPLDSFFSEAEEVLMKLPLDFDFDQRGFIKKVSRKFDFNNDDSLFVIDNNGGEEFGWGDFFVAVVEGVSFGLSRVFSHGDNVNAAKNWISNLQNCNLDEYLQGIVSKKDKIIEEVKACFIDELLNPFNQKIDEIKEHGTNKQQQLDSSRESLVNLEKRKKDLDFQMGNIQSMISSI